jgi:hypothetical protein
MKTTTLFTLAISAANVTTAVKFITAPQGWAEAVGFNVTSPEDAGILPIRLRSRAVAPNRQEIKTRNPHIRNSKTVKIRYGPYSVPGARVYELLHALSLSPLPCSDYNHFQRLILLFAVLVVKA